MKAIRIITIILGVILLSSCRPKDIEYTMVYKVYYTQTESRTYTQTVMGNEKWGEIRLKSDRGTNYIAVCEDFWNGYRVVFQTSAPIEVISYTKKRICEQ